MPANSQEIVSQMRSALRLSEPNLDTTIGSSVRKILDAVAEVVAEASADTYLLQYQYDLEAKVGADLDEFVRLFGFARFPAKRATGTVTFDRTSATDINVVVPVGSQLATESASPVVVATIVPGIIPVGATTIEIPVQAMIGGAGGNIAANSLRRRLTPLSGVTSFTNAGSFSGGTDAESDEQLRLRFRRTVFRNLAGTEQMFLATALEDPAVTQVNVVGATKRYREQIQVVGGTATSTVQDASLVYTDSTVLGLNIDGGNILRQGVHYTISPGPPPVITMLQAGTDAIYDLEIEYVSTASRNDPANGVTNRVDIYVNGRRAANATETTVYRSALAFNNVFGDPLYRFNFERPDGSNPAAGDHFVPLSFVPVMSAPAVISISGVNYTYDGSGNSFNLVDDVTVNGYTPESMSGLVFPASMPNPIADGSTFTISYPYNAVVRDVQEAVRAWRLITTDVRVHQAKRLFLQISMAAMFSPGYDQTTVQGPLYDALYRHIAGISFNQVIQVSDLIAVAHSVPGIDSVRLLTTGDTNPINASAKAIQQMLPIVGGAGGYTINQTYQSGGRATDVLLGDDELAQLLFLYLVPVAQNTFGVS